MMLKRLLKKVIPRRMIAWHGSRRRRWAALTFDDGPDPEVTPLILACLKRHRVPATFFVLGEKVLQRPDLAEQCRAEGHQVAWHGHCHEPLAGRGWREINAEFRNGAAAFRRYLTLPWCYRPVRGRLSPALAAAALARGWPIVLWNRDPRDYLRKTAEEILFELPYFAPGDIILLHDWCLPTASALDQIIARIRESQVQPVTINALLGRGRDVA